MRGKCFTNKNGTRCKGEKVVEILRSPLPPPPTGITRDRPMMILVITVIIYNSN